MGAAASATTTTSGALRRRPPAAASPPASASLLLKLLLQRRRPGSRKAKKARSTMSGYNCFARTALLATIAIACSSSSSSSSSWSVAAAVPYANVTLTNGRDLSVVVFLPTGLKPSERTFYYASRFDHGSMIGVVRRKVTSSSSSSSAHVVHDLFEADMWRVPHNSNWPESGVGLASEFGVGDDGNFCYYRCGWSGADDVTNGVLGYAEAKNGEPFLKIGVGTLLKGTCPTCDPTDDYKFNSPYLFAEPPVWRLKTSSPDEPTALTLEHEATYKEWGYRLVKDVVLDGDTLIVTSTLQNLGQSAFTTAWYSHNFFACDQTAVGPGYEVDLSLHKTGGSSYDEPGTWSWSSPLADYAKVRSYPNQVRIEMVRALPPGVRIKAEFVNDGQTTGGYTIRACDTELRSTLDHPDQSMYAYNLYVERATLSPEPQILIHLEPGQATSWTQRLDIRGMEDERDNGEVPPPAEWREAGAVPSFQLRWRWWSPSSNSSVRSEPGPPVLLLVVMGIIAACCWFLLGRRSGMSQRRHRQRYESIPDNPSSLDGR